jgi:hypothetical protein
MPSSSPSATAEALPNSETGRQSQWLRSLKRRRTFCPLFCSRRRVEAADGVDAVPDVVGPEHHRVGEDIRCENNRIIAGAAFELIDTVAVSERVVVASPDHPVTAGAAAEVVVIFTASKLIVAGLPKHGILVPAALDIVVAEPGLDPVVAVRGPDCIVTAATVDLVLATKSKDLIIAATAVDEVVAANEVKYSGIR